MRNRYQQLLARLPDSLTEQLTAMELADTLWLASYMPQSAMQPDTVAEQSERRSAAQPEAENAVQSGDARKANTPVPDTRAHLRQQSRIQHPQTSARRSGPRELGFTSLFSPNTGMASAIKLLKQKPLLSCDSEVDIDASIARYAEQLAAGLAWWQPIYKPLRRRWQELVLITDNSPMNRVLADKLDALNGAFKALGAFDFIRQLRLDSCNQQARLTQPEADGLREVKSSMLLDRGHKLVVVISDCVGRAWYSGSVSRILSPLAGQHPVAILQTLPQRMWADTALGQGQRMYLRAPRQGCANTELHQSPCLPPPEGQSQHKVPFPVIAFANSQLNGWSRLVSGHLNIELTGIVLPEPAQDMGEQTPSLQLSPDQIIQHFFSLASPQAQRLAVLCAAAPLDLAIVTHVQKMMLPRSDSGHLAELLMSGLLEVAETQKGVNTAFDFVSGARARLIKMLSRPQAEEVIMQVGKLLVAPEESLYPYKVLISGQWHEQGLPEALDPILAMNVAETLSARFNPVKSSVTAQASMLPGKQNHQATPPGSTPFLTLSYARETEGAVQHLSLPNKLLVLSDLCCDGSQVALEQRRPVLVSQDNLNQVLSNLRPELNLTLDSIVARPARDEQEAATLAVTIQFNGLGDFEPEKLIEQIPELSRIAAFQQVLKDLLVHKRQLSELNSLAGEPNSKQHWAKELIPFVQQQDWFSQLVLEGLPRQLFNTKLVKILSGFLSAKQSGVNALVVAVAALSWWITTHKYQTLTALLAAKVEELQADIDNQLSLVLHHPDFRALEAGWRGVAYLVATAATHPDNQVFALAVSKNELQTAMADTENRPWEELRENPLVRSVYFDPYQTPDGQPFDFLVCDYGFDHTEEDIQLLSGLGRLGQAALTPVIAAADSRLLGINDYRQVKKLPDFAHLFDFPGYQNWHQLRAQEYSDYLYLTLPGYLARAPYTGKVDADIAQGQSHNLNHFKETHQDRHQDYCWARGVFLIGGSIFECFAETGWGGYLDAFTSADVAGFVFLRDEQLNQRIPIEQNLSQGDLSVLADLGLIGLHAATNKDRVVYPNLAALSGRLKNNAKMPLTLTQNWMLTRVARYLTLMARDKIGASLASPQLEQIMNRWLDTQLAPLQQTDAIAPLTSASFRFVPSSHQGENAELTLAFSHQPTIKLNFNWLYALEVNETGGAQSGEGAPDDNGIG